MTVEDVQEGEWWGVPVTAEGSWRCPECGESSPVADWREMGVACDSCGDHDGRECPKCGEVFDHVFGAEKLAEANKEGGLTA